MKKLKMISGIAWASMSLILIIFLFLGYNNLSVAMSKLPFMKINPNYSGGEVQKRYITSNCTIDIRRPVFDGFLGERKMGFVQIDWRGKIASIIADTIDYNFDKVPDFLVMIDKVSRKTTIVPFTDKVKGLVISTSTSYGWAVRVKLKQ